MSSFFKENWLWRGTQSAIFYYLSCAPCLDLQYRRKRRNEAARDEKQRAEVISTQPGSLRQPGAFQTNEEWAEEILMGPGPPKGWKRDAVIHKLSGREREAMSKRLDQLDGSPEAQTVDVSNDEDRIGISNIPLSPSSTREAKARGDNVSDANAENVLSLPKQSQENAITRTATSTDVPRSSMSSSEPSHFRPERPRLSMERRLSTAMDTIKDTFRSTMSPEKWNWIRYERDDEILSGLNERMNRMWDKATTFGSNVLSEKEGKNPVSRNRKRSDTADSDQFDYQKYTRNPEINDLHPPVVSQLPANKDAAAWMLLPPPSARVMEGKSRPQDEQALRWPLSRIGRSREEWNELRLVRTNVKEHDDHQELSIDESIPDLSDSPSEEHSTDEEAWDEGGSQSVANPIPGFISIQRARAIVVASAKDRQKTAGGERPWLTTNERLNASEGRV